MYQRAYRTGRNYGIVIGAIGALLAMLIMHALELLEYRTALFALASLLLSGFLIGPSIGVWIHINGWDQLIACMYGSFLILICTAFITAQLFLVIPLLDSGTFHPIFELGGIAFVVTVIFGILPSLLTGLCFGFYLYYKQRVIK